MSNEAATKTEAKIEEIATDATAREWNDTTEKTMHAIDLLDAADLPRSDRNVDALEAKLIEKLETAGIGVYRCWFESGVDAHVAE